MSAQIPLGLKVTKASNLVARAHILVEIWLTMEERRPSLRAAQSHHEVFVGMMFHAHRVAALVETCTMLDNDARTMSLPILALELAKVGHWTDEEAEEIGACLRQVPAWAKAHRLRGNVIAHRSAKVSFDDEFQQALLSPNELRELLRLMVKTADRLMSAIGRESTPSVDVGFVVENAMRALARMKPAASPDLWQE